MSSVDEAITLLDEAMLFSAKLRDSITVETSKFDTFVQETSEQIQQIHNLIRSLLDSINTINKDI